MNGDPEKHKANILAHCLGMAVWDEALAYSAAAWYEKNEPWFLKNLEAKVRQEVRRKKAASADEGAAP